MTKDEIRKEIKRRLKTQETELKNKKDKIIEKKVLSLPEFRTAKVIALYVSLKTEVDTEVVIDKTLAMGKKAVVPAIIEDNLRLYEIKNCKAELAEGPCGILQPDVSSFRPFPKENIDLIVIPGIAFSRKGARLGRGRGFYDRFLKNLPRRIKRIGLAYDLQIVEDLPTTPQDEPVDIVITN